MKGNVPRVKRGGYLFLEKFHAVHSENGNNLYIGNIGAALDHEQLNKLNIKAVLSVIDKPLTPQYDDKASIQHLALDIEDYEDVNIRIHFEKAIDFIRNNLKNSSVLVHCWAGKSRSATLILAFLIKTKRLSLKQAENMFGEYLIRPNSGFISQLEQYVEEFPKL